MKRFFSSTWIILSLIIMALAPALSLVNSSEVNAGSPALQQLVDAVRSSCKDMVQGGDTWKDCEKKQGQLSAFANCSSNMFGPKDSQDRRSFEKSKLDDCQKKINNKRVVPQRATEMLNWIVEKCNGVQDDGALVDGTMGTLNFVGTAGGLLGANPDKLKGNWTNCQGMQGVLTTIGCSGTMFERKDNSGPGIITGKKWYYKKSEVDACQKVINQIKTSPNTKPGEGVAANPDDEGVDAAEAEVSCQGGTLGWILCPFVKVMTDVIREVAGIIDGLMQYRLMSTASSDANSGSGVQPNVSPSTIMRAAWQNFLNIANILLVIAFLAIIFSQATSVGISNYGVKRMLPRLIAGAILMNLSFYICAFAVDITNILGNSILGLMQGMSNISGDPSIQGAMDQLSGPSGIRQGFAVGILAVAAAVAVAVIGLIPVLFGILVVLIVLAVRQVVLTVLILVSPIAFVAWLLPNTEQYFKKWWSLFSTMLLSYPIVMLVFGAAMFVASLLQAVNRVGGDTSGTAIGGLIDALLPLIILTVPLFILPKIITSTNSILGKVASGAHGFINQAGGDWAKNQEKEFRKEGIQRAGMKMAGNSWADKKGVRGFVGRRTRGVGGFNARRRASKQNREEALKKDEAEYIAQHTLDNVKDSARRARAQAVLDKIEEEGVKNREILIKAELKTKSQDKDELAGVLQKAITNKDAEGASAAYNLLSKLGKGGIEKGRETIVAAEGGGQLDSSVGGALAASMASNPAVKDADPSAKAWMGAGGSRSFADIDANENLFRGSGAQDIAKMSPEAMLRGITAERARAGSGMSQQQRDDIKNNKDLWDTLSPEVQHIIQNGRKMP